MRVLIGWLLGITTAYMIDLTFRKWEKRYWNTLKKAPKRHDDPIDRMIYDGEVPVDPATFENDTVNLRTRMWLGL